MKKIIFYNLSRIRITNAKNFFTMILLLFATNGFSQAASSVEKYDTIGLFSDPLFMILLGIIVLLIIMITVLGGVLVNVAKATKNRDKNKLTNKIYGVSLILLLLSGNSAMAQDLASSPVVSGHGGISSGLLILLISIIIFELLIVTVLISLINSLARGVSGEVIFRKEEPSLIEKLNASVAIENEKDIMFDHEYDGIRELDNDLPPWWKYGFYLTIVFALVYLFRYHVTKNGDLQIAEYDKSVAIANEEKAAFQKNNAENVNEDNAEMLTDLGEIAKGEKVYSENCFACHGKFGEGGVGPNLTDEYWLHGGSIKDIFKIIKYGWPDKGMKAWQSDFSPVQIHQVSCYIKTLFGTNPANQKEKQGDLYSEVGVVKDSVLIDSAAVSLLKNDSVKVLNK